MSNVFNKELQLLRQQVAQLTSQNIVLQNRIQELERAQASVAVDVITAAIGRSIRTAEQVMIVEAPEQHYVVSQFQAILQGLIGIRDGTLVLDLPLPEQNVDPKQLSTIQITMAQTPATFSDSTLQLKDALEDVQAAFGTWHQQQGGAAAQNIVTQVTLLLAMEQSWGGNDFFASLKAIADASTQFANELAQQTPSERLRNYRTAVQQLSMLLLTPLQASSDMFISFANVLRQLSQSLVSLSSEA